MIEHLILRQDLEALEKRVEELEKFVKEQNKDPMLVSHPEHKHEWETVEEGCWHCKCGAVYTCL